MSKKLKTILKILFCLIVIPKIGIIIYLFWTRPPWFMKIVDGGRKRIRSLLSKFKRKEKS
jgi:hypothetical protein